MVEAKDLEDARGETEPGPIRRASRAVRRETRLLVLDGPFTETKDAAALRTRRGG